MNPEFIRKNYERGLWTAGMVALAVQRGLLTEDMFKDITGLDYVDGSASAPAVVEDTTRYLLNSTGTTYHATDCAKASTGSLKTLSEIAASKPDAKPCATCNPPALTSV